MEHQSGLLERLHSQVGCEYLSDLRQIWFFNLKAKEYLKVIHTTEYPVWQWEDAIQYLYGEKKVFCSYEDVDNWREEHEF